MPKVDRIQVYWFTGRLFRSPVGEEAVLGAKDIIEKQLEDYNEVFADIVNGLLFDGEDVVKESQLDDMQVVSQYKADGDKLHEEERDKLKRWHDGLINIATIGIENQSNIAKYMPLRIMGYDGAAYRAQLLKLSADRKQKRASTKKGKEEPPFNPVPVVTLVLYFGDKRWDRYHCLSDVIDVPDRLKPFFNDYRINVFEIAWLSEKQISRFKSDFRVVANFFVRKRLDPNYIPDDLTEITHVDEVLKLISAVSGDNRYYYAVKDAKGKVRNMCEVAERLEKRGIEKGMEKGMEKGRLILLAQLVDDGTLSLHDAAIRAGMNDTDFKKTVEKLSSDISDK